MFTFIFDNLPLNYSLQSLKFKDILIPVKSRNIIHEIEVYNFLFHQSSLVPQIQKFK